LPYVAELWRVMRYFTAAKVCSILLGSFEIPAKLPARALSA
jgi:hypothetical protein